MKTDRGRLAFTSLLFLFVIFFIAMSFSYEYNSRLIPLLVGFPTLVLILAVFVLDIRPVSFLEKMNSDWTENLRAQESLPRTKDEVPAKKFLTIVCWIFGFFLSIFLLGFHISIVLFTFGFLKVEGKASWLKALLTAGIVWAFVFLLFERGMNFGLFEGIMFGEIIPHI